MKQVPKQRIAYLEQGDFGEDKLVKVHRGTTLIFKLSPGLHGVKVKLFTNYTTEGFQRTEFHELCFKDSRFDEETSVDLMVDLPGSFSYYFVTDRSTDRRGGGWILVDPDLDFGPNGTLNLDSISIITYMAKCLGPFKDWEGRLAVAKETGFNFIHFTPVQALGPSGSGYSIINQLQLNSIFGNNVIRDDFLFLKAFISKMRKKWGMLSLCDIVLNHTANESPWLLEHPEAAYNLENSPHLVPAYLLDRLLLKVSDEVANEEWSHRGVPSALRSEDQLNSLRALLHEQIRQLRLEELYFISVVDCRLDSSINGNNNIKAVHTYQRFGSKVGGNTPRWEVEKLNEETRGLIKSHLTAAVENVIAGARYERIQAGGPKYEKVTRERPLAHRYFVEINGLPDKESKEILMEVDSAKRPFIMAHNGWVMNDDPLRNFADADSNVYIRRELIPWSDSVKLRYGSSPDASPFLWGYMKQYTELVASVFDGVRLDNCHSTPLHVAEYLIDAARTVRPELLVVAELFTNSDAKDNVFVNHLGINVLIREAQQAWNSHEQGRLLFRYGGKPVGAFENTVPPAVADALFFDQTHDNQSPLEKRCLRDVVPTAALVSFGAFAVGTNRGYDDIVPHHIHVVYESRFYTSFLPNPTSAGEVNLKNGMFLIRRSLNRVHKLLSQDGFSETFIDQLDGDVVSVTRANPLTRESMILVAYTAFSAPPKNFKRPPHSIRAMEVEGEVMHLVFEGRVLPTSTPFTKDESFLTGVPCDQEWREDLPIDKSEFVQVLKGNRMSRVEFTNLQPGDVVAFKVTPFQLTSAALSNLPLLLDSGDLESIIGELDLITLNYVLYRCKEEEVGIYAIPNYGDLVYAGLQGIASILNSVSLNNDLGHPICSNLRGGKWLMDYIVNRFLARVETKALGLYMQKLFQNVANLPNYLMPTYFEQCFKRIYTACIDHALKLTGAKERGELWKLLALSSLQFVGIVDGGALPAGGDEVSFEKDGKRFISYSISAGLPHFSTGYMRNWGRDTFIALPGLFLLTGRYAEAKQHILSYASVMRHGLVPNLMNQGNCRYNCRDATWWWLYSIVRYIELVPEGVQMLTENVKCDGKVVQLQDVVHSSIQSHFEGIKFREENAGTQIDAHMKDEGFNIEIRVDQKTGFIHGGNAFNCGTWMDKMGSSDAAGNRGIPATPRDGAAVEIVGLAAAVLSKLSQTEEYAHKYVENVDKERMSYADWYSMIKSNFESQFFVSATSLDSLINVRNIYKDTVGAANGFGDFQLRPNFLVAMVAAPELFNPSNAILALGTVHEKLLCKLGLKTLDESDWNYNGDYYNMDSSDPKTAGGFNYHQGPEWLWPMGFYLRAQLHFRGASIVSETRQILSGHYEHLKTNGWRSLPELTNKGGKVCEASCPAQAWSCGTLLEVLHDLEKIG